MMALLATAAIATSHAAAVPEPTCAKVVRSISAGAIIPSAALASVDCGSGSPEAVDRYDPGARAARAIRSLVQGEIVKAVDPSVTPEIASGTPLEVTVRVGPIRIERAVVALQSGRPGRRIFVRADNGDVFAATIPADEGSN